MWFRDDKTCLEKNMIKILKNHAYTVDLVLVIILKILKINMEILK